MVLWRSRRAQDYCRRRYAEGPRGIKRNWPDQVRADHAEHECDAHDVEDGEHAQCVGKKAAANHELGVPRDVQNRIRSLILGMRAPDAEELLGTVASETLSPSPDREETCE